MKGVTAGARQSAGFPALFDRRALLRPDEVHAAYPMHLEALDPSWLTRTGERLIGGSLRLRERLRLRPVRFARLVLGLEAHAASLVERGGADGLAFSEVRSALRRPARSGAERTFQIAQALAIIRRIALQELGLHARPNQIETACLLLHRAVAELATGEGKTLSAVLAAGVAALAGRQVHVLTANDYLAERDCLTMAPVFARLGLRCTVITERMDQEERRARWHAQVVYVSNKVAAFDHLRDQLASPDGFGELSMRLQRAMGQAAAHALMRGLDFAIVDEADSLLIDDARTPLILAAERERSRQGDALNEARRLAFDWCAGLLAGDHFEIRRDPSPTIHWLPAGRSSLAQWRERALPDRHLVELEEMATQALSARHLIQRDEQYVVIEDRCAIVDRGTGRTMADRSWSQGLQQMIEIKEALPLTPERETIAQISYQRFFRRYVHLAGMTGTAAEARGEFGQIYGLAVRRVASHLPSRRFRHRLRVFGEDAQRDQAVIGLAAGLIARGQPVLLACRTVGDSERLAERAREAGLAFQILNARQSAEEAQLVARAGEAGRFTIATGMAGRGTDIVLDPEARAAGGLQVILASPGEFARIDRQFEGRSARQGDPGGVYRFLSRDDALLAEAMPAWCRAIVPLRPAWLGSAWIALGQRRAEALARRARLDLIRHDQALARALAFSGRHQE